MKIIIASDGSTDRTIEIARSILDSRVEVLDFPVRQGKANLLNQLVPIVSTPLVAFSDANTIWESGVLRILVRCLDNPKVGVATGQLIMQSKDKKEIASQEAYYVDLESLLRWSESQLGGTLGAYGSVYSLRKDQFIPFPPNTAVDDFYEAMMLAGKGLRTLCLPQARAYEYTSTHTRGEFRRRVRIGTGDFQNLFRLVRLLLPDKGFLALAFLSHKVLRWIGPFFLLFMWLSSAYLAFSISLTFWQWSFWVQTAWHGLALLSWAVISFGFSRLKLLFIPYYFDLINLALFLGFFRAILKAQAAAWQKGR